MPKITKTAACNCGQVQVSVTGDDKEAVHCYCTNCQRATGSAFAHNHRFIDAELTITKGEDVLKQYADANTDSGNVMYRHFCGNCVRFQNGGVQTDKGCPMFLRSNVVPSFVALHEGSIRGEKTQPVIELYPQDKHAWFGKVTAGERKTTPFPWDPDAK
ncbi:Mss4-like protein [Neohortaea acidophila]|uniref:Mss4-like protein n=1 Tax=Neohortaea acidophila TaxID=245834 RepID=A0A6A6PST5_9PEZI|nr:Mss4-like protein [Neohortaea acidophila]KAF2482287.1 Mss4-like protein [Neohortaea acidophila]